MTTKNPKLKPVWVRLVPEPHAPSALPAHLTTPAGGARHLPTTTPLELAHGSSDVRAHHGPRQAPRVSALTACRWMRSAATNWYERAPGWSWCDGMPRAVRRPSLWDFGALGFRSTAARWTRPARSTAAELTFQSRRLAGLADLEGAA